jgi:tripartite-type tricarboxylate transporter receptor subunit TctC
MLYDPIKDLVPISLVASHPNILAVRPGVEANSVDALVALARKRPGILTFASAGIGTSQHLAGEIFKSMARIDLLHVPYNGAVHVWTDLLGGRVDIFFGAPTTVLPYAQAGKVRALAVTSAKRYSGAPELPTMDESGFPGFDLTVWWGLMAPVGTPAEVIEKLHRDTVEALTSPELRKRFADMVIDPVGSSPAEFSAVINAELPKWARIIKEAGISLD